MKSNFDILEKEVDKTILANAKAGIKTLSHTTNSVYGGWQEEPDGLIRPSRTTEELKQFYGDLIKIDKP